mgnify:CR=1 FL=1|jgi:hypothetical protein
MEKLIEVVGGTFMMALWALFAIGELYWLWTAFQIGSFFMFVVGVGGPTILVAAPVGAWSLLFGVPDWVYDFFL